MPPTDGWLRGIRLTTRLESRPRRLPPRRLPPPTRRPPPAQGFGWLLAALLLLTGIVLVWRSGIIGSSTDQSGSKEPEPAAAPRGAKAQSHRVDRPANPWRPQGPINRDFPGLTTFRGNATRSYYGEAPLPKDPVVLWRYPRSGAMCLRSESRGRSSVWCGTGWTGQPTVIPLKNELELRFGAYDGRYHFLDARTGTPVRSDLRTGDLAKGSATSDPDGYPLYYAGSRDNLFRIVALDRQRPTVLWSMDANKSVAHKVWNDDWDGAPLVIGDYLLEGGENSWFYVIRLNRHFDRMGYVNVRPQFVMRVPGYDRQLFRDLGDRDVSIENSVAFRNGIVYFANSGGLVQGWDIRDVLRGGNRFRRIFRFWVGDQVDASIVIDRAGYLYVARHPERNLKRTNPLASRIGDLTKLDPRRPRQPVVWTADLGRQRAGGGILSTPALYNGVVYVMDAGRGLLAVDQKTGKTLYELPLVAGSWSSPVPINQQLLVGDCSGVLHNFDISSPRTTPKEIWRLDLPGCIESTPAVWKGMIWVGTRGGAMFGIGDRT